MRENFRAARLVFRYLYRADPARTVASTLLSVLLLVGMLFGAFVLKLLTDATLSSDQGKVITAAVLMVANAALMVTGNFGSLALDMALRERATLYFEPGAAPAPGGGGARKSRASGRTTRAIRRQRRARARAHTRRVPGLRAGDSHEDRLGGTDREVSGGVATGDGAHERKNTVSTRGITSKGWHRRLLAIVIASLAVVTSLTGISTGPAGAAPSKTTTTSSTSTSTSTSSTTTIAPSPTTTVASGGNGVANPKLTAVVSLSRHRVLATYDRPLDAAALQVSSYAFNSTQAVNLPVTGVLRATDNQAYVMTAAQEPVTYTVKLPKTSKPLTFTGKTATEPKVVSVTPLSKTQILVTFSEPMGPSAFLPANYQVTVQGSTATLAVTGATQFGSNGTQVLLTTAPQSPGVAYILTLGPGILSATGTYPDPTSTNTPLTGSAVAPGPMMLSATSDGNTRIVLNFDVPLDPTSATSPASYTITPNITVESATLQGNNKQVVLVTGPQYVGQYTLVVNVKGTDLSPVNPGYNSTTFTGTQPVPPPPPPPPPDSTRPKVVSAASTNNKTVVVQFSEAMADNTPDTSHFAIVQTVTHPEVGALVVMAAEFVDSTHLSVRLTTLSQAEVTYQVTANNVTDVAGNPLADKTNVAGVIVDPTSFVFPGTPPTECAGNPTAGTVATTAGSKTLTGTSTKFKTLFKVGDVIHVAGETDRTIATILTDTSLTVTTAFATTDTGLTYRIGCPDEPLNSDTDTLYDHEETRGWQVVIKLANGTTQLRQVTSSPFSIDTDGDGLKDHEERALNTDPRDADTDDDGIGDEPEFNVYYSDPTQQDSDADGLFDGLETSFFLTSPIFADTDGDQLKDGYEISVNRNPKVADLPQPALTVGEMRMGLDVRFVESNGTTTRQLAAETAEATLVQSASQEFSSSDSTTHETSSTLAASFGQSLTVGYGTGLFGGPEASATLSFNQSTEATNTNSFTSEFTESSSQATEQAYTNSLTTEAEAATDSTVTREVLGATMQLAVTLAGRGNVAFTARNLQVAALIQDPFDPKRLTPIATLVPATGLGTEFNLGPLVPPKGPIVFETTNVYPLLIDQLMNDPRGLVFRFANYDIVDEAGRNFAFTSQEVNDRTARVAIDYGGYDPDGDGRGTETEILRVATGIMGRVVDTNGDGVVDDKDRKVVFDPSGKQVGITLRDALSAAGLQWYDEATTPSNTLTAAQRASSYSTFKSTDKTREIIFRVRDRQLNLSTPESWEIVNRIGIDRKPTLDERILYPGDNVTLMLLSDLDGDRMPALTEAVHNCKDSANPADGTIDTDKDGLDDRFEVMVGWTVNTQFGSHEVHSKCSTADSDKDGLTDLQEAPGVINKDAKGLVIFEGPSAPRRNSAASPGSVQAALDDPVTDPTSKDTDLDGLADGFETTPYKNGLNLPLQTTSPEHPDTDGDGLNDGVERKLGGNPRVDDSDRFTDSDRDGLTDAEEIGDDNGDFQIDLDEMGWVDTNGDGVKDPGEFGGWVVLIHGMNPRSATGDLASVCQNAVCPPQPLTARYVFSSRYDADTDDDGLSDYEEKQLKTDPGCTVTGVFTVICVPNATNADVDGDGVRDGLDTDNDGLSDFAEVRGFKLADGSTVKTKPTFVDTDNDKRSDGEEAGLAGGEFIVRLPGGVVYQAQTHPLKADTDFDLLVDGDEQSYAIDPTKPNTDGDNQGDYGEVLAGRRPAVADMLVKVHFARLLVEQDSEPGGDAGDFEFKFDIVRPDGTSKLVVHSETVTTAGAAPLPLGQLALPWSNAAGTCPNNNNEDRCFVTTTVSYGQQTIIRIIDGESLPFGISGAPRDGRTEDIGSVSTIDAVPEQFGIRGYVMERGGQLHDSVDCRVEIFPDIFGSTADGTGLVKGSQLRLGENSMAIHRKTSDTKCNDGGLDFTLMVSYTAM